MLLEYQFGEWSRVFGADYFARSAKYQRPDRPCRHRPRPGRLPAMPLLLRKVRAHYNDPTWSADDYVVLDGDDVIGRLDRTQPEAETWLWSMFEPDRDGKHRGGLTDSREAAMAAFKATGGLTTPSLNKSHW